MRTLFLAGVVALIVFSLPGVVAFAADLLGYGADLNAWAERVLGVSHRLALSLPAGVILFCVPPLIALLYFLRLKRKPLAVPSTFLWKKSVEDLHVNRLMQWMRRNVLLLLQLLAALLVIYSVLGPRTRGALQSGRHYILLLDNSVSMSATDVPPTRLEWAKAEALKTIDSAADGDPGMLIVFNSTAEIRQSYTNNKEELKAAVRAVGPTEFATRIDEALALAASRANPNRSTENAAVAPQNPEPGKERTYYSPDGFEADVYLLSDGRFPPVADFALQNLSLKYPQLPAKAERGTSDNVGIVRFDATRDGEDTRAVLATATIHNYRNQPATVKVWLDVRAGDGRLLGSYRQQIGVPAKELWPIDPDGTPADKRSPEPKPGSVDRVAFLIPDLPDTSDAILELHLEQPDEQDGKPPANPKWVDALPADDRAWVAFGVARKATVLVVTKGNKWIRNYFDTKAARTAAGFRYLDPADLADPKEYLTPAREGKYDLVIFDRCGPAGEDQMPVANTLFIGHPPPPYTPLEAARPGDPNAVTLVKNPTIRGGDDRHPVVRGLKPLDEVWVTDAFRLPFLPPRTPRLLEGDQDLVLLAALPRQAYTDLVLTFPIASANADGPDRVLHTNWPLLVKFPMFLRNVLYQLGNVRNAGAEDPLKPGQMIPLRIGAEKEVFVAKPGQDAGTRFDRGNRPEVAYSSTDRLGVYTAEWGSGATKQTRRFAVNLFDPEESNLAPVNQFKVGAETVTAGDPKQVPRELWKLAVLLGLAVVLLEWWIYNRRVQI
jgi:hypothetical protein